MGGAFRCGGVLLPREHFVKRDRRPRAEPPRAVADAAAHTLPRTHARAVIAMGCRDACPIFPGKRYENWELPDPAGQAVDAVRPIRDDIEERVRRLLHVGRSGIWRPGQDQLQDVPFEPVHLIRGCCDVPLPWTSVQAIYVRPRFRRCDRCAEVPRTTCDRSSRGYGWLSRRARRSADYPEYQGFC